MAKNKQKPEHRCGDCRHYEECNAILHGELNRDESFPESTTGCLAFRQKEEADDSQNV